MNSSQGRILVIDDELEVRQVLEDILREQGHTVDVAEDGQTALSILEGAAYDVVLTDHFLGDDLTGVELCAEISTRWPTIPVIVLTAYGNLDVAVSALRANAFDFLTKPCRTQQLEEAITQALDAHSMREQVSRLRRQRDLSDSFGSLVGESRAMRALFQQLARAANTDLAVLLTGATGTGKGRVAQALHSEGPRGSGPFEVVHCSATDPGLLDQELFGGGGNPGALAKAHRGSLFLRDIAGLSEEAQGKLLRVLQKQALESDQGKSRSLDVRILASTTEDLREARDAGSFREDLYFRLNALQVQLPALRARGNDVLLLAQHFLEQVAEREGKAVLGFGPDVAVRLLAYPWPGNIRELENVISRAVVLAEHGELGVDDLPEEVQISAKGARVGKRDESEGMPSLADLEQEHITRVLEATRGNKQKSARILGVDRSTLYRKMARYGIVSGTKAKSRAS